MFRKSTLKITTTTTNENKIINSLLKDERPLSRSYTALACFFFRFPDVQFTARPEKPRTFEISQECLLCYDRQITAKIRTCEQATEPQAN